MFGSQQQLRNLPRSSRRKILLLNAMPAAFLADVLAQQLAGFGIEDSDIAFGVNSRQTFSVQAEVRQWLAEGRL
jgi:hypothetical protein